MLTLYCKDAEERRDGLLTATMIRAMDCLPSAGLSDELEVIVMRMMVLRA
jgi:hypothetical protein